MTHFSKFGPFFQASPIFPTVTHFSTYNPFFKVSPVFPSETHFSSLVIQFLQVLLVLQLSYFGFSVSHVFLSMTPFSKSDIFQSGILFFDNLVLSTELTM